MTDSHSTFTPRPLAAGAGGAQKADTPVATLIADLTASLADAFTLIAWAEDEIDTATRRHRDRADTLYHAFGLIQPRDIGPGMSTEFVYRSHARELLQRVAADADTRPATATEICLACAAISLRAPLHAAAAGLYFRMWLRAFPGHPITTDQAAQQLHYEHLHGPRIDDLERTLRRKLADPNRRLADIECSGRHHGTPVNCRYATPAEPAKDRAVTQRASAPLPRTTKTDAARLPNGRLAPLLLAHLQAHPELDFSPHELRLVLGHSHGTIRRHLLRLAEAGQVTQTRHSPARFQIAT